MDWKPCANCARSTHAFPLLCSARLPNTGPPPLWKLGATDYVTKPSNVDMTSTIDAISRELIPKIRALCHLPRRSEKHCSGVRTKIPCACHPASSTTIVLPAASGGDWCLDRWSGRAGAASAVFAGELSVARVIAHHMPPIFTSLLAARLTAKSSLPVRECVSGEPLMPGCVVIAPGDFHLVVSRGDGIVLLRTHQGVKENFCRPSVDVLFHSIASIFGARALAVVLTGMGQDGLRGCEALRAAGARIFVQDEASNVVWGMQGFVGHNGLADKILPLDQIGAEIVQATALQVAARTQS